MPKKSRKPKSKKRAVHKKAVRKKKPVKKARKKKTVRKKKKTVVRKTPKLPAEPIGRVTHYFAKARATALMIERDGIRVGDTLYFKGHTTNFKQTVESLQIDRKPVPQAEPGEEVGIRVRSRTREHDLVFKL